HPPPFTRVLRPCSLGDGIRRLAPAAEAELLAAWERAARAGRISKLVPASGAASRMFKALAAELHRLQRENGPARAEAGAGTEAEEFFANLPRFAFFEEVAAGLSRHGLRL